MLERVLVADLVAYFLVFSRVGTAMMVLPGFGETFVAVRVRLLLALAIAAAATPVVVATLPSRPDGAALFTLLLTEMGVGLFIGTVARLLATALQVAGTVIAFQINLSSAFVFDPMAGQQNPVTASFLSTVGLVLLFVTDLHHLLLRGLVDSYGVFVPGVLPPVGDFVEVVSRLVSELFRVGLQLAAPFLLIGVLISVAMGLLSRLMPQVQIFFVAAPVQIIAGVLGILLTISFGMSWFLEWFEDSFSRLLSVS